MVKHVVVYDIVLPTLLIIYYWGLVISGFSSISFPKALQFSSSIISIWSNLALDLGRGPGACWQMCCIYNIRNNKYIYICILIYNPMYCKDDRSKLPFTTQRAVIFG